MDKISGWITTTAQKYGLYIGLAFTLLVGGLIVVGHTSTSDTDVVFKWETRPGLFICEGAPAWFRPGNDQFEKHLAYLKAKGASYASIESGVCDVCEATDAETGKEVRISCKGGYVAVDVLPVTFQGFGHPEEEGKCVYPSTLVERGVATENDWTTILVPDKVLGPSFFGDAEFGNLPPVLPADAYALVAFHESGHCFWGLAENKGPSLGCGGGCRLNPKTGHFMNPNLLKAGWNDEGVQPPKWE
jgi:hypothetical protein